MISPPLKTASRKTGTRQGATLVEVLMALLVMGIGVTSIFTLFPLSIIRSIKASQLTNAKIVEENARELIIANPRLVVGAPVWQPGTSYGSQPAYTPIGGVLPSDAWVAPQPTPGRLLPQTNLLFRASSNSGASAPWYSTQSEPRWPTRSSAWVLDANSFGGASVCGGYRGNRFTPAQGLSEADIFWTAYMHSPYPANTNWSSYVVDPLGWYEMNDISSSNYRDKFGSNFGGTNTALRDRIHSQLSRTQANELFRSRDTWFPVLDAEVPVALAGNVLTYESNIDLTETRRANGTTPGRLVFLSEDGSKTLTLPINVLASNALPSNQVAFTGTLPADFDQLSATEISSVRIDAFESRYSWMMTVRRGPQGQAEVDVVIFFNRSFDPTEEEAITAEFGGQTASLSWPAGRDGGDPLVKEGNFIFDAENGHWYRIQKVESHNKVADPRTAVLTLNTTVEVATDTVAPTNYDGQAILLPSIVNVFHLSL